MRRLYLELVVISILIILDVLYVVRSSELLNVGETTLSSAGFYPLLLGSVLGILLIGCGFQVAIAGNRDDRIDIRNGWLVFATLMMVICFTALWQFMPLGFYVAAFALVFGLTVLLTERSRRFKKRSILVNLAASVGTVLAVYLVFDYLFGIPLTRG